MVFNDEQGWTQMGSILYILYPTLASQVRFLVYNISDNTFIPDQYISSRRHMQGCVASFENMIYVTGGWDVNSDDSRAVSILDLSTEGWSTGTSMNQKRGLHGCVVVPDNRMLYAIGGRDNQGVLNQYLNSVESISIDLFNSWTTMTDVLSESQQGVRAVIYEDYKILVLPGEFQGPYYSDVIEVINTRNNSIYSSNYRLPRAMMSSSPVVVGNKLYVFGGSHWEQATETWTELSLTPSPTTHPTLDPTFNPTTNPTNDPTLSPTVAPITC